MLKKTRQVTGEAPLISRRLLGLRDQEAPRSLDDVGGLVQVRYIVGRWGGSQLNLDRPELVPEIQNKVQFVLIRSPEVICAEMTAQRGKLSQCLLDNVALPARADPGLHKQCALVWNVQQRMHETAVAPVELGPLDEAFADVRLVGWQLPEQEGPHQVIEVVVDGVVGEPQALTHLDCVPHLAVQGGQHAE